MTTLLTRCPACDGAYVERRSGACPHCLERHASGDDPGALRSFLLTALLDTADAAAPTLGRLALRLARNLHRYLRSAPRELVARLRREAAADGAAGEDLAVECAALIEEATATATWDDAEQLAGGVLAALLHAPDDGDPVALADALDRHLLWAHGAALDRASLAAPGPVDSLVLSHGVATRAPTPGPGPAVAVPGYRLLRELGRGGAGAVYLARHEDGGWVCALKVVRPGQPRRFAREVAALRDIGGAHLVEYRDSGRTADEVGWIATTPVCPASLADLLAGPPLEVAVALELAAQILAGLASLHERLLVHRDLKPANILIDGAGRVRLTDFGLVRGLVDGGTSLTRTADLVGTPRYMSPEQVLEGSPVGTPADIWSFGAVLWELLVGRPLFAARRPSQVYVDISHATIDLDREEIPPILRPLLGRCLERDLSRRFVDAGAALAELSRVREGLTAAHDQAPWRALAQARLIQRFAGAWEGDVTDAPAALAAFARRRGEALPLPPAALAPALERPLAQAARIRAAATAEATARAAVAAALGTASSAEVGCRLAQLQGAARRHLRESERLDGVVARALGLAGPAPTHVVGPGGDHTRIADALAAAPAGSRILVRPGTYRERIVLETDVELIGDGPRGSVVLEYDHGSCLVGKADEATVRGLTIRRLAGEREAYAVHVRRGRLTLVDCELRSASLACAAVHGPGSEARLLRCHVEGAPQGGLLFFDRAGGRVEDCEITGNATAGVEIRGGADPVIVDCRITGGAASGVTVLDGGRGRIEDCQITGNARAGLLIKNGGDPLVVGCQITEGRQGGVFVYDGGRGRLEGCTIGRHAKAGVEVRRGGDPTLVGCRIQDGEQSGVHVHDGGRGRFEGCVIAGNGMAGVSISQDGDPAIIGCELAVNQFSGVSVFERGRGRVEGGWVSGNGGAGVEVRSAADPRIRRVRIEDNRDGVSVFAAGLGRFEDCRVHANRRRGVHISERGAPTLAGCDVTENPEGGIAATADAGGVFTGCEVRDNPGGDWLVERTD